MVDSLKDKGIYGIKWSFIDNIANSGITFIVGLILARILTPLEFGIIGIITIFIAVSNAIVDGGFSTALLRKNSIKKEDYNTAFYSNLFISIILFFIFIFSSNSIAVFFGEPILQKIIPIMSSLLIINALTLIQRTIYIKKIDFKTQAKVSFISSIGSGILGVISALSSLGIWSLVIQQISRQFLLSFFLWLYSDWRPSLLFSKKSFKELFGFGVKILGANIINSLFGNIFTFIIGKIYSVDQLGQYSRAEQFNTVFSNNLTAVVSKVSFPILSSVQEDSQRITKMFRKIIIYTSIVTFTLILFLAAIAEPLILLLIGEKWIDSIVYLQIMSFYAVLYPVQNLNLTMMNIAGRSDIVLKLELIKKIIFIPVLIVGFYFSIEAMLWSAVVYHYLQYFLNTYYVERYFRYGIKKQIKDLTPIFSYSFVISFFIWSVIVLNLSNLTTIILQVILGVLLYSLIFSFSKIPEYKELKGISIKEFNLLFKK